MSAEIYRTGTEYVWFELDVLRNPLTGEEPVGLYLAAEPEWNTPPAVSAFHDAILVSPDHEELGDGEEWWIAQLVGPDSQVAAFEGLSPGDYQAFTLTDTGAEKIIRRPGMVTIL